MNTFDRVKVSISRVDYAADLSAVPYFYSPTIPTALERQVDLAYGEALFLSEGGNRNGYYFTRQMILGHYKSVIMKPLNIGHEQTQIIGMIYDVGISKKLDTSPSEPKLELIPQEAIKFDQVKGWYIEGYDGPIDMWIHFAMFRGVYPGVVNAVKNNVSGNMDQDQFFISMEVLVSQWDYLFDNDEATRFERTTKNALELDPQIGRSVAGKRLYKVYKGSIVFGGGGIVGDPAEPRAVLTDLAMRDAASTKLSVSHDEEKHKYTIQPAEVVSTPDASAGRPNNHTTKEKARMELSLEQIQKTVDERIQLRQAELQKTQMMDEAKAHAQALGEEVKALTTKNQELVTIVESAKSTADKALKEAEEALENSAKELETAKAELDAAKKLVLSDADKAEFEALRSADRAAKRFEVLKTKGVVLDEARVASIRDRLGKFTDAEFATYIENLSDVASTKPAAPAPGAATTTVDKAAADAALKAAAAGSPDGQPQPGSTVDKAANRLKALASLGAPRVREVK
jgi:hypothetical protein